MILQSRQQNAEPLKKPNELVSEGPSESRPTRPAHPDLVGLADILTEPESVQVSFQAVLTALIR